jgi:hypothetical protein
VIYAADGLTSSVSGAVYGDLGQPLAAAGAWLTPHSQTVMVPADGEAEVHFAVTVPRTATPGDHLAGIAAQSGAARPSGSGHLRVIVVARAVVGVLVRVPGPASFDVAVGKPTIDEGPEHIGEVVTPITDTGRLIGKPIDSVSLRGPNGYLKMVRKSLDTLLPGGTAQFPVYWPDPLHGRYEVTSCVSGAGLSRSVCISAAANIAATTATVGHPGRKQVASPWHLPSWAIAVLSAGIGCAITGAVMGVRRSRRHDRPASLGPDTALARRQS